MPRYACVCSYDGYDYMGFQIQKDLPTIELEIENAFLKLLGDKVKIYPSGRTDKEVHAVGQVFHFDLKKEIPPLGILKGLNAYLPQAIAVLDCKRVADDFHARFWAVRKEYRYSINTKERNPLTARYSPYRYGLDPILMKEALTLLVGCHDFKGFASASIDPRKSTVKTIECAELLEEEGKLVFRFIGNGFLKYQIRRMVGLLIEIGLQKEKKELITEILEKKIRNCRAMSPRAADFVYTELTTKRTDILFFSIKSIVFRTLKTVMVCLS